MVGERAAGKRAAPHRAQGALKPLPPLHTPAPTHAVLNPPDFLGRERALRRPLANNTGCALFSGWRPLKSRIIGLWICYDKAVKSLDCKSERQILEGKTRIRPDVHFCNKVGLYKGPCTGTAPAAGLVNCHLPRSEKRASGAARRVPKPFRRTAARCIMSVVTDCGKQEV